jgi:hypothetical protein
MDLQESIGFRLAKYSQATPGGQISFTRQILKVSRFSNHKSDPCKIHRFGIFGPVKASLVENP